MDFFPLLRRTKEPKMSEKTPEEIRDARLAQRIAETRGAIDNSDAQQRRRTKEGNTLLMQLVEEFGRSTFTVDDLIDAFGDLGTWAEAELKNNVLRASLRSLERRELLEREDGDCIISAKGHDLAEEIENDLEAIASDAGEDARKHQVPWGHA